MNYLKGHILGYEKRKIGGDYNEIVYENSPKLLSLFFT